MILKKLIEKVSPLEIKGSTEIEISSLVYDSRKVEQGSVFVCMKGAKFDAHSIVGEVVKNGAVALIVTDDVEIEENVTIVKVADTRIALAFMSAAWFNYPAAELTVIGLTGTKGKTTTAHMIKSILEASGEKTGMIGTMGAYIGEEFYPTRNTTPESYELENLFRTMVDKGVKYVVMEASSQAFKLNRTAAITFDYAAFLNISPDHIGEGEHKDFEEYLECKSMMFKQCRETIVNIDADKWDEVIKHAGDNYFSVSVKDDADLRALNIKNLWNHESLGVSFDTEGLVTGRFELSMPGIFNVQNALIAIAVCGKLGVGTEYISEGLKKVSVKGRTQLVKCALPVTTVIIDYAHNALSMKELLMMLKSYNPGRLICLFGGGGNKPKARRYDMGSMSGKYADITVLTTDNPRFEEVENINNEILEGVNAYNGKYSIILDRKEAIRYLLDNARKDDIIALIGKGHEEYQDIKGTKYHFSELEIIEEYMAERMKSEKG